MTLTSSRAIALLAHLRRAAGAAHTQERLRHIMLTLARRERQFLEEHMPDELFTMYQPQRIAELEEVHREALDIQAKVGANIANAAHHIDAVTTVEQRCDVLNVNAKHRTFGGQSPGVLVLTLELDLEDSALTVGDDSKTGPMFHCLLTHIARSRVSLDEAERLHVNDPPGSLFHPDGPYFGIPDFVRHEDGTVEYCPENRLERLSNRFNVNLMPPSGMIH